MKFKYRKDDKGLEGYGLYNIDVNYFYPLLYLNTK